MASLSVYESGRQLVRIPLGPGTITVGRLRSNEIVLDNAGVSRRHLRIDGDPTGMSWILEDLQSLNGTWVNNHRVGACLLRHGDEIRLGKHALVFEDEA